MDDYFELTENIEGWIEYFKKFVLKSIKKDISFYKKRLNSWKKKKIISPNSYFFLIRNVEMEATVQYRNCGPYLGILKTLEKFLNFLDLFDIDSNVLRNARAHLSYLYKIDGIKDVETIFNDLKKHLKNLANQVSPKSNRLSGEEKRRINEAFECLNNEAHYSSIVMSASAMEHRLLNFLAKVNKSFLTKNAPTVKVKMRNQTIKKHDIKLYTLGRLSNVYLYDKKKFKNKIPQEHEKLLGLCNDWRIFSAHPKKVEMNKRNAKTIMNSVLNFLLDKRMKI